MWLNKLLAALLVAIPLVAIAADKTTCPASLASKDNVLTTARLFDGDVSENVELAPDNEKGATWDISGYKNSGRTMHLVCDYKNGEHKDLVVSMPADRCYVKGKKTVTAWCGK